MNKVPKLILSALFISAFFVGASSAHGQAVSTVSSPACPTIYVCSVKVALDATNPASKLNYVDSSNGAQNVPIMVFRSSMPLDQVNVSAAVNTLGSSGVAPSALVLYNGTTQISYQPFNPAGMSFNHLLNNFPNPGNLYTIKADFLPNTVNGTVLTVKLVNVINQPGGSLQSINFLSNSQYFYHATPNLSFVSGTASLIGSTTVATTLNFTLTPYPGQARQPLASDFQVSSGPSATSHSSTLVISPQPINGVLSAGQTYNLSLSNVFTSVAPGTYTFSLSDASTTIQDSVGNWAHINQNFGLDNFKTNPLTTSTSNPFAPTKAISTKNTTLIISRNNQQANVLSALESLLQQAGTTNNLGSLTSSVNYALGNLEKVFGNLNY